MLRIVIDQTAAGELVYRLAGHLRNEWVAELRHACERVLQNNTNRISLTLDLSDVAFMDAAGLALCGELASRGVALANCSLFTAAQLKGSADVEC
jgi:anti-anti-sigma regulatory factor